MRKESQTLWTGIAVSGATTYNSDPIWVGHMGLATVEAAWTGTPTGTIRLQASLTPGNQIGDATPTGFEDIGGSSLAVTGSADSVKWNLADMGYNWIRIQYVNTTGSGTMTAQAVAKGF